MVKKRSVRQIGKDFEEEVYRFLKKKYDRVYWLSKDRWNCPIDFECYKDGKKIMIECKTHLHGCYKDKDEIDFFATLINGKIQLIPYENVRDSEYRTVSVSLPIKWIRWAKKRHYHEVYFIEKMFKREIKREMVKREGKKK